MLVSDAYVKNIADVGNQMAKTVTIIFKLSPTHFVSNIRHQHRYNNKMKTLLSRFRCILFSSICSSSCIGRFLLNKSFKPSPSTKQYRSLDYKCQLYDSGKNSNQSFNRPRTSPSWISSLFYSCFRKASSSDVLSCGFLTII